MAMPNELQVGRLNRLLTRLLSIKGSAPAPVLTPELLPALVLESDRPEWEYLRGGLLLSAMQTFAAVVGQAPRAQLRNPAGSGTLIVIEAIDVQSVLASDWYLGQPFAAIAAGGNFGSVRDLRALSGGGGGAGRLDVDTNATIAVTGPLGLIRTEANAVGRYDRMIVLPPGRLVGIVGRTLNTAAVVAVHYRERELENSEA